MFKFRSWKTLKSHGISKAQKLEYKPCLTRATMVVLNQNVGVVTSVILSQNLAVTTTLILSKDFGSSNRSYSKPNFGSYIRSYSKPKFDSEYVIGYNVIWVYLIYTLNLGVTYLYPEFGYNIPIPRIWVGCTYTQKLGLRYLYPDFELHQTRLRLRGHANATTLSLKCQRVGSAWGTR